MSDCFLNQFATIELNCMKEVIKFLIGKFDYIKTEVLIGVLSAALVGIISRGVNCIRNVWKQNKKIKISQVFSTYAEVEQLPIVTEVKEKNNVGDGTDNIYYKKSFLKAKRRICTGMRRLHLMQS